MISSAYKPQTLDRLRFSMVDSSAVEQSRARTDVPLMGIFGGDVIDVLDVFWPILWILPVADSIADAVRDSSSRLRT